MYEFYMNCSGLGSDLRPEPSDQNHLTGAGMCESGHLLQVFLSVKPIGTLGGDVDSV